MEPVVPMTSQKKLPELSSQTSAVAKGVDVSQEFEDLFQQHWERICAVAYRLVGDSDEAQDLALEAFVQLYRQPPQEANHLPGWLYRVVTRLGYNALRSQSRRKLYETQGNVASASENLGPETALEVSQENQQVRLALTAMKPRSAQLLILRSAGLSYQEIAQALSIAQNSVGTLLARAEREFEKKFGKETES